MVQPKLNPDQIRRLLNEQFAEHFYFERLCELPNGSVRRALMGSGDRRTEDVIAQMLDLPWEALFPIGRPSALDEAVCRFAIATTAAVQIDGMFNRVRAACRIISRGTL